MRLDGYCILRQKCVIGGTQQCLLSVRDPIRWRSYCVRRIHLRHQTACFHHTHTHASSCGLNASCFRLVLLLFLFYFSNVGHQKTVRFVLVEGPLAGGVGAHDDPLVVLVQLEHLHLGWVSFHFAVGAEFRRVVRVEHFFTIISKTLITKLKKYKNNIALKM